ncbi:MAG: hypothetical protein P8181_16055, partial [bacterium]
SLDTPGQAAGVFAVGPALYVCDGIGDIQIVDASDPEKPQIVSGGVFSNATFLAVAGDMACATNGSGYSVGLLDVSDPWNPSVLYELNTGATRVALTDSLLALAQGYDGVSLYRPRWDRAPEFLKSVNTGERASDLAISGDYVFVANGGAGLAVIDVTTPTQPRLVGGLPLDGFAAGICLVGARAVVAAGLAGLYTVDVSVPLSPVLVGHLNTTGYSSLVYVSGETAYVAEFTAGIQIVDIGDPANPRLKGSLNTATNATGVTANRFFLYATDDRDGLLIARAQCAGR